MLPNSEPVSAKGSLSPSTHLLKTDRFSDVITSIGEFAETVAILGSSDLSKQLSSSLTMMADVERKSKEVLQEQSRFDVVTILGTGKPEETFFVSYVS